jgi:biopolymer transport protein ExbD
VNIKSLLKQKTNLCAALPAGRQVKRRVVRLLKHHLNMKTKLILLIFLILISCTKKVQDQQTIEEEIDEIVDIRIFPEDQVRFNGKMISESGLYSHIQNLNISDETRARIIFDENVSFGVITQAQKLLYEKGIKQINAKGLSAKEFLNYDEKIVHIDILNSDKLLFDGDLLHTEDLEIALNNTELPTNVEFIITVSERATFGAVYDVQKLLAINGLDKISNEDLPEYQ